MELQALANRATQQALQTSADAPGATPRNSTASLESHPAGCNCDAHGGAQLASDSTSAAALASPASRVTLSSEAQRLAANASSDSNPGSNSTTAASAPRVAGFASLLLPRAQQAQLAYQG